MRLIRTVLILLANLTFRNTRHEIRTFGTSQPPIQTEYGLKVPQFGGFRGAYGSLAISRNISPAVSVLGREGRSRELWTGIRGTYLADSKRLANRIRAYKSKVCLRKLYQGFWQSAEADFVLVAAVSNRQAKKVCQSTRNKPITPVYVSRDTLKWMRHILAEAAQQERQRGENDAS